MKSKVAVDKVVFSSSEINEIFNEYDLPKNENVSQNSFSPKREENFLYRHKKFDLLEIMESDEIRSSKSESFSHEDAFSGIDIPVDGEELVQSNDINIEEGAELTAMDSPNPSPSVKNVEEKEEKLNVTATSNSSPSNDDDEDNETDDKAWVLDIDNSREKYRDTANSDIKSFPDPIRIDFDYASTLPRLNTVANFEDKSIVAHNSNRHTSQHALPSSDYETDLDNLSDKLQDSKTDKDVLPAKGAPYYFNTIKANFRDKKVVSYIPRPALRVTSRDFRAEPTRTNVEEERKNELKRIKQEELKICNTNLGELFPQKTYLYNSKPILLELLSHMFSVHPMVRTRHNTKASALRSVSIQQRQIRHRQALESRQRHDKLHPREWQ